MSKSILNSIKKALGLDERNETFDVDLVMFINSSFLALDQLGVGPEEGFSITGTAEQWSDYISEDKLQAAKTYVYIHTKMLFDPPPTSFGQDAMRKVSEELGWRLFVESEKL